jgi:hypothetical protein
MPVVKIVLKDKTYERLAAEAEKNYRDPRSEAAWLLTRELERADSLRAPAAQPDTPKGHDGRQD